MKTRPALVMALLYLPTSLGCASFPNLPPPGPQPVPEPWRPDEVLRERLPRRDNGEVVLNDRDGLSPDEAAIIALDRHPRLQALRAERGIARAEVLAAGILPNPRLDAALSAPVSGAEAHVLGYGIGLTWNATPLLARSARLSASKESVVAVDLELAWQEWQVAQAARLHAVRAIYQGRRIILAGEIEEQWQQRLSALRHAQTAGAVTELEVASAERSLAEARVSRLELQQRLAAERAALNQAIGLDSSAAPAMDSAWALRSTKPPLKTLLAQLQEERLDLIALQHAAHARNQALRAAALARFPAVELGVHSAREVDGLSSAGVSVSIELPFFDRNQGSIARERAGRLQLEAEYETRLLEARSEVARLYEEDSLVEQQLAAATEAANAAIRLAALARAASSSGAMGTLVAVELQERAYATSLRKLEIEQTLAELRLALVIAAGRELGR